MVRAGLQALLAEQDGLAVVGQVAGGEPMLGAVADLRPDVAVLDLPGDRADLAGLDRLARAGPGMGIVVVSGNVGADFVAGALEAGVGGILLRDTSGADLVAAARAVHQGLVAMHPAAAQAVLRRRVAAEPGQQSASEALTQRELDVAALLARGLPNKTIASRLHLSEHTVKFHVASIMGKLGAASRTEAVTIAARQGLIAL